MPDRMNGIDRMNEVSSVQLDGTGRYARPTEPPLNDRLHPGTLVHPVQGPLRPAEFARRLLATIAASEGRRKRRKRDTTPDSIGLGIKHDLLSATMADDPDPDDYEGWLLERALAAPASGPVRALCVEIFAEYRFAAADPGFGDWLAQGAPSADAESEFPVCEVHPPGQCPSVKETLREEHFRR
jgi:hypothetical protein